jgi:hypothetical protein
MGRKAEQETRPKPENAYGKLDTSAVSDEPATRLVLFAAQHTHRRSVEFSAARQWVSACLQSRGNSPRQFANTLIFLAPDEASLENLFHALADRRATDQVILNALVNPQAALTGEATFHLAVGFDQGTGRYSGLRPQQDPITGPASLATLVVKDEVALAQIKAERLAEDGRIRQASKPEGVGGGETGPGLLKPGVPSGPGSIGTPPPLTPPR